MGKSEDIEIITLGPSCSTKEEEPCSESSAGSNPPDVLRNDFPNARRRNLHAWAQWRTEINDSLSDNILHPTVGLKASSPSRLSAMIRQSGASRHDPTSNPKTLLSYSASHDNVSALSSHSFINFGIPRARISQGSLPAIKRTRSLKDLHNPDPTNFQLRSERSCSSDTDYWRMIRSEYVLDDVVAEKLEEMQLKSMAAHQQKDLAKKSKSASKKK